MKNVYEVLRQRYVQPCPRDLVHMEQGSRYLRIYLQEAGKA